MFITIVLAFIVAYFIIKIIKIITKPYLDRKIVQLGIERGRALTKKD